MRHRILKLYRTVKIVSTGVFLLQLGLSDLSEWDWDGAARRIARVDADGFKSIPPEVAEFMRSRTCRVPQPGGPVQTRDPVNVVSGSFGESGQIDWAILCSDGTESSINIFWGGPVSCREPLQPVEDKHYLVTAGNQIEFARVLAAVNPIAIRRTYEYLASDSDSADSALVVIPEVDHDAVEDVFQDKASQRFYCRDGAWTQLVGSD